MKPTFSKRFFAAFVALLLLVFQSGCGPRADGTRSSLHFARGYLDGNNLGRTGRVTPHFPTDAADWSDNTKDGYARGYNTGANSPATTAMTLEQIRACYERGFADGVKLGKARRQMSAQYFPPDGVNWPGEVQFIYSQAFHQGDGEQLMAETEAQGVHFKSKLKLPPGWEAAAKAP